MLDYSELNRIAAKNNGILTKLDLVYQLATGSYGELSRFSIALIDNKVVSNYYVKDKLSETEITISKSKNSTPIHRWETWRVCLILE